MTLCQFKSEWLDAVHARNKPTSVDLHVAHTLFNKYVTGVGLPFEASMIDMAAEAGMTKRGLQMVIARLVENGLMRTKVRKGRGKMNEFEVRLVNNHNN